MQLKYLKSNNHGVNFGRDFKYYPFTPIGDVPEQLAKHLLKHFPNDYEVVVNTPPQVVEEIVEEEVKQEKFTCEKCGKEFQTNAALKSHNTFKHKES